MTSAAARRLEIFLVGASAAATISGLWVHMTTRYCMRIAPGETVKTCRQVGAHRKEKQRNGTEFVRKEYQKVYNRLRGRKNRGIISTDEWNRQVAAAQELKAQAIGGGISDAELNQRFRKM